MWHSNKNSIFLGLIMVAVLSACGGGMPKEDKVQVTHPLEMPNAGITTPAKVTMLLPLSGRDEDLGIALQNAATMAFADHGYSAFELVFEDTGSSVSGASRAAEAAVQNRSHLILGPIFAPEAKAAGAIAARAGIPLVSFSTDLGASAPGRFVMGVLPQDQAGAAARYIATKGLKTALVIAPRTTYGQLTARAFSVAAQGKGFVVIPPIFVDEKETQISFLSRSLGAAAIQVVFMPMPPAQLAHLLPSVRSITEGQNPVVIGTSLLEERDIARRFPALQGVLYTTSAGSARTHFLDEYRATYGQEAPRLASLAYDSISLALVLGRAGFLTQHTIAKLTDTGGYMGVDGPFRFSPYGYAERYLDIVRVTLSGVQLEQSAPAVFTDQNP